MTEQNTDVLWGAEEIGAEIGRSAKQTFYLLASGQLPARKVGRFWVAERGKLREFLTESAA